MTRSWVDDLLLEGPADEVCLVLGSPVDRAALAESVRSRQRELTAAGLAPRGTVALWLPPSLAFVVNVLAVWRAGAQVQLLDHRLTRHEVDRALSRLLPQFLVAPATQPTAALRGFHHVRDDTLTPYPGCPDESGRDLIQLSSGSTGPSKIIGRTAVGIAAELERYQEIDGVAGRGQRIVVLASMVHVLGLVGGLLHGLRTGARVSVPRLLTVGEIAREVQDGDVGAVLLGVPSQAAILAAVSEPPQMPLLARMITGGEPLSAHVRQAFSDSYRADLGSMYGMTEVGVIATDLHGRHHPALTPAPGMQVREVDGELLVCSPDQPYLGPADPLRWAGGWLRTKDAGEVDARTGLIRVLGRLDSQISVRGLKVDLVEVEQTISALPGIEEAVVVFDQGIQAYVSIRDGATGPDIERLCDDRIARYKRPQTLHLLPRLPRTTTGKPVRDTATLRAAASAAGRSA